jgi:uncharacterized protein (DUF1800 family)
MMDQQAASAANRFGLGARGDEIVRIGDDPRGWLLAQIGGKDRSDPFAGLPDSGAYLDQYHDYLRQQREMREQQRAGKDGDAMQANGRRDFRRAQQREFVSRQRLAATTSRPFTERLVRFWSNHFAISVDKFQASLFAAPMEREAIRPHLAGRFADMLLAVERHPGMLVYLDNAQSIGVESRLGAQSARRAQRNPEARKRGLNENLAREILELHTLGVDGGYAQADVAELARAITGWSVARPVDRERRSSEAFVFRTAAHEPGARRVLAKAYAEAGEAQGEAILRDLAVHPATARHLSLKLARHFVADQPPPVLVDRMAKAYLASGGELAALYRAMVENDAAWSPTAGKFKSPEDFVISALRACQLRDDADLAFGVRLQGQLGHPVFQPRSPAGFGDIAADWGGPDALFKRVQAAQALAERLPASGDATPQAIGEAALGTNLDGETAKALRRAESVQQGVALLLASPVFQWRR